MCLKIGFACFGIQGKGNQPPGIPNFEKHQYDICHEVKTQILEMARHAGMLGLISSGPQSVCFWRTLFGVLQETKRTTTMLRL